MKKAVLKLEIHDECIKQKALKTVSCFPGVESIAIDMKDEKLTVVGDIDAVVVVKKLRKICRTDILTVGPAKEPEKKPEPKKPDPPRPEPVVVPVIPPNYYYWHANTRSMEENPNSCVIF